MGQGAITGQNNNGARPPLGGDGGGNGVRSLPDNIVQALMSYRMQAPLVDELLEELGFEPKGGLGQLARRMSDEVGGLGGEAKPATKDATKAATKNDRADDKGPPKDATS